MLIRFLVQRSLALLVPSLPVAQPQNSHVTECLGIRQYDYHIFWFLLQVRHHWQHRGYALKLHRRRPLSVSSAKPHLSEAWSQLCVSK